MATRARNSPPSAKASPPAQTIQLPAISRSQFARGRRSAAGRGVGSPPGGGGVRRAGAAAGTGGSMRGGGVWAVGFAGKVF